MLLFLCGDVMVGRGIDQMLPFPSDPQLYEPFMHSAAAYVELAAQRTGPIPHPVSFSYIWGDILDELNQTRPDARIINLETSVTMSREPWPGKEVCYKMHPANIPCLTVAGIDCCVLANNHILDWGYDGLFETLATLDDAGIHHAGAGRNLQEAREPAVIEIAEDRRILVLSAGSQTSGVPTSWNATDHRAGIFLIDEFNPEDVQIIAKLIAEIKRPGDIAVVSIHWGGNWGYAIPDAQQQFARMLIDTAGADIIHGHSSHHVRGMEVYHEKLILYGCGDFINDYEGISGYESFRPGLTLMYFATVDEKTGMLLSLRMVPLRIRHFRLNRASCDEAVWMQELLTREGEKFGNSVQLADDNALVLV